MCLYCIFMNAFIKRKRPYIVLTHKKLYSVEVFNRDGTKFWYLLPKLKDNRKKNKLKISFILISDSTCQKHPLYTLKHFFHLKKRSIYHTTSFATR